MCACLEQATSAIVSMWRGAKPVRVAMCAQRSRSLSPPSQTPGASTWIETLASLLFLNLPALLLLELHVHSCEQVMSAAYPVLQTLAML